MKGLKFYLSHIQHNFRLKLLCLFFLCIILPTLLLSVIFYYQSNQKIKNVLNTKLQDNLETLENSLYKDIHHIHEISNLIYMNRDVQKILAAPSATMDRFQAKKVKTTYVVDSIGELVFLGQMIESLSTKTIKPHLYLYERNLYGFYDFTNQVKDLATIQALDWYYDIPRTSDYQLMEIPYVQEDIPWGLCYIRRLYGLTHNQLPFAGMMIIPIHKEPLLLMLENLKPTPGSHITYVNEDQHILLTSLDDASKASVVEAPTRSQLIIRRPTTKLKGSIIVTIPKAELYRDVNIIGAILIIIVVLTIGAGIFISKFLSDSLTEPINKLVYAMENTRLDTLDDTIDYTKEDEFGYLIGSYNDMTNRLQTLIKQLRESELNALQSQINPHFLYNTLDSINWLSISRYGAEDISEMITNLSDFFRYGLSGGETIITLRDEMEHVKRYLQIQKCRYGKRFDYELDLPDALSDYQVVKITLQPLIENALAHGFLDINYTGFIRVYCTSSDATLTIHVTDNGVGVDPASMNNHLEPSQTPSKSYGLRNVNQRLEYYFGSCYGIRFIETDQGTHATVTLPKLLKP